MFEFLKHLFKLQFLLIVVAVVAGIYYPQILERVKEALLGESTDGQSADGAIPVRFESGELNETLFNKNQLATFNGEGGVPIYLAILGSVYDVSKGIKHYGPGCSYNYFVGRDASVSFITGEFEHYDEATADDVVHLKPNDLLSLANWKGFYDKDYTYKGKLIGRFYDTTGAPTVYHHKYLALLEQAREIKATTEQLRSIYPECNIEWSVEKGTRVWCTTSSGGNTRSWAGHPRKLFEVGSDSYRCACLREDDLDTKEVMIKPYDDCERLAHECFYSVE